jgi:hypothetical protein
VFLFEGLWFCYFYFNVAKLSILLSRQNLINFNCMSSAFVLKLTGSAMKAPSLLVQCFPGLVPSKASSCVPVVTEKDLHLPSPAVEIIPSKSAHPYKYAGEKVDVQGLDVFKGKVSVADMIAFSPSEVASTKHDGKFVTHVQYLFSSLNVLLEKLSHSCFSFSGSLKYWESSITLVNIVKNEIRDGQLSFRGKRVLEVTCHFIHFILMVHTRCMALLLLL